jgi:membrane protein YdbS with pleckstrin-like domain
MNLKVNVGADMSKLHRVAAITSAFASGIALAWTAVWLASHSWRWSNGAGVVTLLFAISALFLVCLSFRDQSTRRSINLALGILAITAALYVFFPREISAL